MLTVAVLFICSTGFSVKATTSVDPSRFIFSLKPGERGTDIIKVSNKSTVEKEFKAALYDWTLDKEDHLVTLSAGTREDTLDGLIKFNPRQFKLQPGETQIVRFTVKSPPEDYLERRGVVFFEEETEFAGTEMGATVVTQVGATIYIRPEEIDLTGFNIMTFRMFNTKEGTLLGILVVDNQCTAHMRYSVHYKVIDANGKQLEEGGTEQKVVLPGFQSGVGLPLNEELNPGDYNMLFVITFYGTDKTMQTTYPFSIK